MLIDIDTGRVIDRVPGRPQFHDNAPWGPCRRCRVALPTGTRLKPNRSGDVE